jgi:hypothetical protein
VGRAKFRSYDVWVSGPKEGHWVTVVAENEDAAMRDAVKGLLKRRGYHAARWRHSKRRRPVLDAPSRMKKV